ncbi:serine/threonine-protein phosphatase [Nocardia sp. CDC159]|uniref:Serine/threonine-protein phosphatase n=1 Tax=Nocardia pulmonis TaxID=2951408 RepID=A0A9X2E5A4_9NOCA|nr:MULTISPECIES: PP2C family serine/threonine-protein phosphatase [Nocardia]MCM6773100.1 serine/threonine-protein phosphatase [Nocardia pulmonis]MCM6785597.1 serine/threonine-protein phosphatase [Nocardia sp. CDC159]
MSAPTCPGCGARTRSTDRFCEQCGRELAIRRAALPDLAIDPAAGCAACGAGRLDPDGYCTACGELRRPPDRGSADLGAVYLVTDRGKVHARNEDAVAAAVLGDVEDEPAAAPRPGGDDSTLSAVDPAAAETTGSAVVITVCDGVSTSEDPQAASGAAARAGLDACLAALTADRTAEDAVMAGLEAAFQAVRGVSIAAGHSPSCTYVTAVLRPCGHGEFEITVANVGDSRAYWLRAPSDRADQPSRRLTVDDSWAQALVDAGAMDEVAAMRDPRAHALVRWLGADSEHTAADTRVHTLRVHGPGVLLLCSDGLWNYLSEPADLAAIATSAPPAKAARNLVDYAIHCGGADNITVALAPVSGVQQ